MSSTEVLEKDVATARDDLKELKTEFKEWKAEFRAVIARIDSDVKSAVSKLETDIRAMSARAESDLKQFASRFDSQFAEMRQDMRELRAEHKALREKIDKNHETANAQYMSTDKKISDIGSKLTNLAWVIGGLGTLITVLIAVGNALHWF